MSSYVSSSTTKKLLNYVMKRFPEGEIIGKDEWNIQCPRCRSEKNKAFINLDTGKAWCHHCQWRTGGWWDLVGSVENISSRGGAERWFEEQQDFFEYTYDVGVPTALQKTKMTPDLPVEFNLIYKSSDKKPEKEALPFRNYLSLRGIKQDDIIYHNMGYCLTGKYANRVIIPVINDTKLEFFCDRLVPELAKSPEQPKTIGIGGRTYEWPIKKGTVIFNLSNVKEWLETTPELNNTVYVAEGIISALSISPLNTVALLGKTCSGVQLKRLLDLPADKFVLCLDPGTEEYSAKLAYQLEQWDKKVSIVHMDKAVGDPNNYILNHVGLPTPTPWTSVTRAEASRRKWINEF